jgi:glyoxylase-like metal-dependent hydrolase (beta-lactamase superfamily II)
VRPVEQLAPGLWSWTVSRSGIPETMTAYALRDEEGTVLVDPLSGPLGREPDEAFLAALDEIVRGRVRIVITTPFHVRGSGLLWQRWRDRHEVTIYCHEQCVHPERLTDRSAFQSLRGGEELEGGVRVHTIGKPKRAEMPIELPSHRAIAFGDSVLEVDGGLRVWEDLDGDRRRDWYEQRFRPTLEALVALDIQRVLVTHGEPVLQDGARALRQALNREPWVRPPTIWSHPRRRPA